MKKQVVHVFSALEATKKQMPYYNAFTACGTGVWNSKKHKNRAGRKTELRRELAAY